MMDEHEMDGLEQSHCIDHARQDRQDHGDDDSRDPDADGKPNQKLSECGQVIDVLTSGRLPAREIEQAVDDPLFPIYFFVQNP